MLKTKKDTFKGKTCTVSGSGNVAQYTVEKLNQLGGKVVTLSDSSGMIYDPDGIDNQKLSYVMDLKNIKRGRIKEYAEEYNVEYYPGKRPWEIECDLAFPSATQNEISKKEAQTLVDNGVLGVAEGANMPTEADGVEIFLDSKILYGPGKAANAGGVATSALEMTQNSQRLAWTREEVDKKLQWIMQNIHQSCVKYGRQDGYVNYVDGANIAGFVKVADSMLDHGLI